MPPVGVSVSPRETFVDPILALRANFTLAPRSSLIACGDFGGFGQGSEQTRQFAAGVNHQVSRRFHVSGVYRTLSVDYADGGTRIDARMSGPILGATRRF